MWPPRMPDRALAPATICNANVDGCRVDIRCSFESLAVWLGHESVSPADIGGIGRTTQPATHGLLSVWMDGNVSSATEAIQALSVLGGHFDVQLAVEISGLRPSELLRALDIAQGQGLLVVEDDLVTFTSEGLEQARRALGSHGRAQAHAHAAEVLERVRPRDLSGIAEQRAGAVAVLGLEPALSALDGAAIAAERALDWMGAARQWQLATKVAGREHDGRAGPFAIRRARCLYRAGLFAEAVTECRRVASEARAAGNGRLLAEASLVVRGIGDYATCAVLLDLCSDALRSVGEDDVLRSRLHSQVIMLASDLTRVPTEASEAQLNLLAAEATGDVRALVEALHALHSVSAGPRNAKRRLEIADRSERLCLAADLEDERAWSLVWRIDVYFQLGERPALDNAIFRLEEYADRRNDALATWRAMIARAALAEHEGRYDDALKVATEALELAERGGHQAADLCYRILAGECRIKTTGGSIVDVIGPVGGGPDVFKAYYAMTAADSGDFETADALFRLALPVMDQLNGSDLEVATHLALAKVAWALDRDDAAPAIYRSLAPLAEELGASSTLAVATMGSVSRYLGQMATLMRDWPRVEIDFARAMRRNLETGARGEVAETRFDWARALLRHNLARDRERAAAMLNDAARGAAELGMEPLRRRAADALAALKAGPSLLTDRELEIASMVAEGLTNKEIATRLRLSVRTAENHVLNVMNKLGLDNRAAVAAWYTRSRNASPSN
jgi:DNA-binding CsgD family transcriptional regulator